MNAMPDEYRELSEDWRHRDQMIWATPTVIITVSVVLMGIAFQISNLFVRLVILLAGLFWTFAMIHALIKHHYYQKGSEEKLRELEPNKQTHRKSESTQKSVGFISRHLELWSAYRSLLYASYFDWFVLLFAFLFTLYKLII